MSRGTPTGGVKPDRIPGRAARTLTPWVTDTALCHQAAETRNHGKKTRYTIKIPLSPLSQDKQDNSRNQTWDRVLLSTVLACASRSLRGEVKPLLGAAYWTGELPRTLGPGDQCPASPAVQWGPEGATQPNGMLEGLASTRSPAEPRRDTPMSLGVNLWGGGLAALTTVLPAHIGIRAWPLAVGGQPCTGGPGRACAHPCSVLTSCSSDT